MCGQLYAPGITAQLALLETSKHTLLRQNVKQGPRPLLSRSLTDGFWLESFVKSSRVIPAYAVKTHTSCSVQIFALKLGVKSAPALGGESGLTSRCFSKQTKGGTPPSPENVESSESQRSFNICDAGNSAISSDEAATMPRHWRSSRAATVS